MGGKASFTYGWLFTVWGRFGYGPFWLESWAVLDIDVGRFGLLRGAVLVFCCMISSTVDRFGLGRFGDGPFWYRPGTVGYDKGSYSDLSLKL